MKKFVDEINLTEVKIIHRVPVFIEENDLGDVIRQAKAEVEEKEKQEFEFMPELKKLQTVVKEAHTLFLVFFKLRNTTQSTLKVFGFCNFFISGNDSRIS